jgi:hypothetical protein
MGANRDKRPLKAKLKIYIHSVEILDSPYYVFVALCIVVINNYFMVSVFGWPDPNTPESGCES